MKTAFAFLFLVCMASIAQPPAPAPKAEPLLSLYVATLLYQDGGGNLHLMSYSDAEAEERPVAAHVAEFLERASPGSKIVSLRVDVVGMEEVEKVCRSRHPKVHF